MGKMHRYQFTKNLYNDYVVFLKIKGKYVTYNSDLMLMNYLDFSNDLKLLKCKHINYLILDDLDIIELKCFEDNNYNKYYLEFVLEKVIRRIGNKLANFC